MKEYKTNDINNLITELLMSCMEHTVSVYIDRREAMVMTDASVIRNNILDKLEEVGRDFPIPTSMQRLTIGDENDT